MSDADLGMIKGVGPARIRKLRSVT